MSEPPAEQRGERASRQPLSLAQVGRWLQGLVQASAILAAAGYFSLRSHFNYLGVSSSGPIGAEPYLRECAYMVYELVDRIALPAVVLAGGWLLLGAVGWVLLRRAAWRHRLWALRGRLSGWLSHAVTGWLLLAYMVRLYVVGVVYSPALDPDAAEAVAIGPLQAERLRAFDASSFDLIYVSCIVALWLCYRATRTAAAGPGWRMAWAISLLLCIHLPILFGRIMHERSYQAVRVDPAGGAGATCGLLIANAGGSLLLWRAQRGVGEILSVPAEQRRLVMRDKPEDLLALAQRGADAPQLTLPQCEP